MLEAYELYRCSGSRVVKSVYENRYSYVKKLVGENNQYLELFRDPVEVLQLVDRYRAAYRRGMAAGTDGWQKAMKDAGIWDDDDEALKHCYG